MDTVTMPEIQERVHAAQENCWDAVITMGELVDGYEGGDRWAFDRDMTPVARQEMLARVGVPTKFQGREFFDSLAFSTQQAVVQDIVNTRGLRGKEVLTRWWGDTLRAVVSGDYTCVPHAAVVDALAYFNLSVRSFYPTVFTPTTKTMHVRLTTSTAWSLNGNGDEGLTMIHVRNSEIGKSALAVDVGIWREVCTNGLLARIGGKLLLQERHIYREPEELLDKFDDAVAQAERVAAEFVKRLRRARETNIPIEHVLERLPSERMRDQVRERIEEPTLFGVYNAITRVAQERTFEAQYEWEKWARRLLDIDWPKEHSEMEICPTCGGVV